MASKKILILESDPGIRDAMLHAFSREGFQASAAADRTSTVFQLVLTKPDLIILNLLALGQEGQKTLAQIREFSAAPLIGIAEPGDVDAIVSSLDSGVDQVITQPFNLQELQARARALLRRASSA
jgi:DNA-binding response OmpR family regulator